jgi:putative aminopeptidase FrvX
MAVYETSLSNQKAATKSFGDHRGVYVIGSAIIAATTAMIDNANDDVGAFWVEAGAVVTGATFAATDIDSATAFVVDVGDSADEDRFIAGATTGQAEGLTNALAYSGFLYKFTARTQVRVYVKTAAGTPVAGTIKVALFGFYDPEFSTTALTAA